MKKLLILSSDSRPSLRYRTFYPFIVCIFFLALSQATNAQVISTVAGELRAACSTVPCGDGGPATAARLYSPSGMSVDPDGNIYVAEFSNHVIRKIDIVTGTINTVVGTQRSACNAAPCGDGGLAVNARLNGPRGVFFDNDGHMYIADFSNHVIRKVDKNTGIIATVAGTMRSSCLTVPCGDGGLATEAQLNSPTGVSFDAQNNMYIADYGNHIIRKVDKLTGIISTVAGTMKSSCSSAPCGDGGAATLARFNGPSAVDIDSEGNLYIAEYGNHSIRRVDMLTGIITTYAGTQRSSCTSTPCGDGELATSPNTRLTNPFSLRVGPDDNVYIADASNAAIRKVDRNTNIITTVAGIPRSSCGAVPCGEGGLATSAQLSNPFALDFSPDGNTMYIAEYSNQAIRKVTPMGLSILPVQLKSISAIQYNGYVQVKWEAHQEEQLAHYDIERSTDGKNFSRIGTVNPSGAGLIKRYEWTDRSMQSIQQYYRIRAVDLDGSAQYSPIVVLSTTAAAASFSISPNPVTGNSIQVTLDVPGPAEEMEMILYNAMGQPMMKKAIRVGNGRMEEQFILSAHIGKGVYTLLIGNRKNVLGRQRVVIR